MYLLHNTGLHNHEMPLPMQLKTDVKLTDITLQKVQCRHFAELANFHGTI